MLFRGQVIEANLRKTPRMISRTVLDVRRELRSNPPVVLDPPDASGTEVVEATPEEWAGLTAAGYALKQGSRLSSSGERGESWFQNGASASRLSSRAKIFM